MTRECHVRFCESAGVRSPRATHLVVGFQHETDARRFLDAMRERLQEFALSLHPEKTRLIEFGRFASKQPLDARPVNWRPSNFWALPSSAVNPVEGASC